MTHEPFNLERALTSQGILPEYLGPQLLEITMVIRGRVTLEKQHRIQDDIQQCLYDSGIPSEFHSDEITVRKYWWRHSWRYITRWSFLGSHIRDPAGTAQVLVLVYRTFGVLPRYVRER